MINFNKRACAALITAVALSVAGGVAAVNATGPSEAQQAREFATAATGKPPADPHSAPTAQLSALGVFRRDARVSDRPPAELLSVEAQNRGAQLSAARNLRNDGGDRVYALPVHGGVCLTSSTYVVQMCLPDAAIASEAGRDALTGFQSLVCSPYLDSSRLVLYGIVADGVQNLRFIRADGSTVAVSVMNNFAYYSLRKGEVQPVRATWQDSSGESFSDELPLPADAGRTECDTSQTPSQALAAAKRQALAHLATRE